MKRKREVESIAAAQQVKAVEAVPARTAAAAVAALRQEAEAVAHCRQQDAFRLRCKTAGHHRERIAYRSDNISSAISGDATSKDESGKGKELFVSGQGELALVNRSR